MKGLIEGRNVHFVLDGGEHRPAIVVKVWRGADGSSPASGLCNLQVFTDSPSPEQGGWSNDGLPQVMWKTSVSYSEKKEPGTWHWIEPA